MLNRLSQLATLSQWLNYLETCHPKKIDLGLQRVSKIAERLNVLRFHCPVITVAGTNGKGSCVALTTAILSAAGYRVATYTSPHLIHYNERIQIADQAVTDITLCHAFEQIEIERAQAGISLSYFEFGTLAALWLFKQAQLDAIILEVGLGGRLDAVNCVASDLAIISTIDFDHMDYLGHTLEAIGKEKAGIMRAHKPCVCGDFSVTRSICDYAAALNSPLYLQGSSFNYKMNDSNWSWKSQQQVLENLPLPSIELQNAATVLQAIELLSDRFSITRAAIEQGLKQTFLPGRFQKIEKNSRKLIVDVAHNPAGGRCFAKRLSSEPCLGKTHAVVGMLANKDIINTLQPFKDQIDYWHLASLEVSRGATAEQLYQSLMALQITQTIFKYPSPQRAYQDAYQSMGKEDRLLIFGSFHTVSAILKQAIN